MDTAEAVRLQAPSIDDGVECWRLARDSAVLDLNSRYAYLLWCRDFAATSVVARGEDAVLGFITGYRRPEDPDTLMVWQVAVDAAARGLGLAGRMLDGLFDRVGGRWLETTVSPDNAASTALFSGFARRRGLAVTTTELFGAPLLNARVPSTSSESLNPSALPDRTAPLDGSHADPPDDGVPREPHQPEWLYRIGPVTEPSRRPA